MILLDLEKVLAENEMAALIVSATTPTWPGQLTSCCPNNTRVRSAQHWRSCECSLCRADLWLTGRLLRRR